MILSNFFQAVFIFFVVIAAGQTVQVFGQAFAAPAHISDGAGGVAEHEGVVGCVAGDDGAGADEGVAADGGAADDGAVGAKRCALFNERGSHLVHFADFRPGVVDVGKNHGRTAEDAVFQGDPFVDGDVVLNFASLADVYIRADDHVLPDVAVFTDSGVAEDVGEVPDFGAVADTDVIIHNRTTMSKKKPTSTFQPSNLLILFLLRALASLREINLSP